MYQHQVHNLFKHLDINYWKFYNNCMEYKETNNGRLYDYSSVANYIDIQLHLKNSQNS
jgi:beta-galactosidase beta subunit